MADAYLRSVRGNLVVPASTIQCISAVINPDNSYSFRYSSDVNGQQIIYQSLNTHPDPLSALQEGYNSLVITLP